MSLGTWFWILFILMIVMAFVTVSTHKAFQEKNQIYALKQTKTQKTGAQVAQEILAHNGITDVKVVKGTEGADHFNPQTKTVSLSPSSYDSSSVSAMSIAAHEVGHAIQHHKKSIMIRVRTTLQPAVAITATIGQSIFAFSGIFFWLMIFGGGGGYTWLLWTSIAGLLVYGAMGIFQLITLPVEFDASKKAIKQLKELNMINTEDELKGAKGVLKAAAMTYVVAFLTTAITLAMYIIRFLILTRGRN